MTPSCEHEECRLGICIANSLTWPCQMTRPECAFVLRISVRELHRRIVQGRWPAPPDGKTWSREDVDRNRQRLKEFQQAYEKQQRRGSLAMVGGR